MELSGSLSHLRKRAIAAPFTYSWQNESETSSRCRISHLISIHSSAQRCRPPHTPPSLPHRRAQSALLPCTAHHTPLNLYHSSLQHQQNALGLTAQLRREQQHCRGPRREPPPLAAAPPAAAADTHHPRRPLNALRRRVWRFW